jgi:hypothetical protein
MAEDRLTQAKEAQKRVQALQTAGVAMNDAATRQAVNRLMAQLRKLSPEERAAFDEWKANHGC